MTQLPINFDIQRDPSARKHKGAETSIAAHQKIVPTKQDMYRKIMELAVARGDYGITVHEVAGALGMGKAIHRVSGRLSEMVHKLEWLQKTDRRRNDAYVLVVRVS